MKGMRRVLANFVVEVVGGHKVHRAVCGWGVEQEKVLVGWRVLKAQVLKKLHKVRASQVMFE